MAQDEDRDLVGVARDRRDRAVVGGGDRGARCRGDADPVARPAFERPDDAALHGHPEPRRVGGACLRRGDLSRAFRLGHGGGGDTLFGKRCCGRRRNRRDRACARRFDARDLHLGAADRDQKVLPLAEREVRAEPVPFGERRDRHAVGARDGEGRLARRDPVASRLCGSGKPRRALGAVDGRSRDGRHVHGARLRQCSTPRFADARGQRDDFAVAERDIGRDRIVAGQLFCREADPRGHGRDCVAAPGDGDLVARIGDDTARVRLRPRRRRAAHRIGGVEAACRVPQVGVETVAGAKRQRRRAHRGDLHVKSRLWHMLAPRQICLSGPLSGPRRLSPVPCPRRAARSGPVAGLRNRNRRPCESPSQASAPRPTGRPAGP